ncbi:MAG: phospholipase D-like domain-containing protein [Azonexus sp.]|nr:phospholipase D-like domain-containing protein [Azonexus sp.]
MTRLLPILLLCLAGAAQAGALPCGQDKGGVSHCEGIKFVCNDGGVSASRRKCPAGIFGTKPAPRPEQTADAQCGSPETNAPALDDRPACNVQVGFSPEGSASALVLQKIAQARQSIRLAAYSFTAQDVAQALVEARKRGVDVRVIVDDRGNHSKASQAALTLLVQAGIPTRTVSAYAIHHDKYMVIDGSTIESGSFNYTRNAERRNSENALTISEQPTLARQYLEHWQSRWDLGKDWPQG